MKNYKYIPLSVFQSYDNFIESTSMSNGDKKIVYESLNYCYKLLNGDCNDFQKIDIISHLRRTITKRIKTLFNIYKLDKLNFNTAKKRQLEKLEELGIIKPLLIKELLDIRNDLEYSNKKPPNKEILNKLIDTVWYFIRSTDIFTSNIPDTILFENINKRHWMEVSVNFKNNLIFELGGWLPNNKIYHNEKINTIKINVKKIYNKNDCFNPMEHKNKLETDIYIMGNIEFNDKQKINFIKDYLFN